MIKQMVFVGAVGLAASLFADALTDGIVKQFPKKFSK